MIERRLLNLIGSFSDPGTRSQVARELAHALKAEDALIFSKDPVLEVLLPAPGFPQTLPEGREWKKFVANCQGQVHTTMSLVSPYSHARVMAHGLPAPDGSILVLLGKSADLDLAHELLGLIPLVVSSLETERISLIARSEYETEKLHSEQTKILTNALDSTRRNLESELRKNSSILETLTTINKVGRRLAAQLELDKLVQQVTDDATRLTGAQFGAFFYNAVDSEGKILLLNVVSGVSKDEFKKFPNPRATEIFYPTLIGAVSVRSGDITKDPRYGKNAPYNGIPQGHLPVRSYLAVPVVSGNGQVIGGLFFGHENSNVFNDQSEMIAEGLAAQAAVAMDNAMLYKKAQEAVRVREEFLSIASHELKTPLTSLKLQSQIRSRRLQKEDMDFFNPQGLRKMLDMDLRQLDRLGRLIEDMLDISKIKSGKLFLRQEKFDLGTLVSDVIESYSSQIDEAKCPLKVRCDSPVEGVWDKFRIEQVFTNLLTNAIRYGKNNPIEVTVESSDNWAILKVTDRGVGIAKENQARIFERFERAISPNEISGLGLGLYIAKQIIDMHHGTIELESEFGVGSQFTVKLPLRDTHTKS